MDNQNVTSETPAGWGIVIVEGDTGLGKGAGEILEEISGLVITDVTNSDWFGAEVGSNNTAELSAFLQALRWILANPNSERYCIKTDSTYAGNIVAGNWKAKQNLDIVRKTKAFWDEVNDVCMIRWEHVRAHTGHRWNERADHLAIRAASKKAPIPLSFWKPGQR